jgi:hypothetical protein
MSPSDLLPEACGFQYPSALVQSGIKEFLERLPNSLVYRKRQSNGIW